MPSKYHEEKVLFLTDGSLDMAPFIQLLMFV